MQPRSLLFIFCFVLIGNSYAINQEVTSPAGIYSTAQPISFGEDSSNKPCHKKEQTKSTQSKTDSENILCDCCEDFSCMTMDFCNSHLSTGITTYLEAYVPEKSRDVISSSQVFSYLSLPNGPIEHKPKA